MGAYWARTSRSAAGREPILLARRNVLTCLSLTLPDYVADRSFHQHRVNLMTQAMKNSNLDQLYVETESSLKQVGKGGVRSAT